MYIDINQYNYVKCISICPNKLPVGPLPYGHLQESHKRLSKIALRLRPELLRYLLDRTLTADAGGEDPDTMVTVQSFLCHYDRSFRSGLVKDG